MRNTVYKEFRYKFTQLKEIFRRKTIPKKKNVQPIPKNTLKGISLNMNFSIIVH